MGFSSIIQVESLVFDAHGKIISEEKIKRMNYGLKSIIYSFSVIFVLSNGGLNCYRHAREILEYSFSVVRSGYGFK